MGGDDKLLRIREQAKRALLRKDAGMGAPKGKDATKSRGAKPPPAAQPRSPAQLAADRALAADPGSDSREDPAERLRRVTESASIAGGTVNKGV